MLACIHCVPISGIDDSGTAWESDFWVFPVLTSGCFQFCCPRAVNPDGCLEAMGPSRIVELVCYREHRFCADDASASGILCRVASRSHPVGLDRVLGDVLITQRAGKEEGTVFTHFSSKLQNATEPLVSAAFIILRRFLPFLCFYSPKWVLRRGAFQALLFSLSEYSPWAQVLMGVRSSRREISATFVFVSPVRFLNFIVNWSIIAYHYCVSFCSTTV